MQTNADSVIISFRLQPGASARVDQRFNKLDVVFTAIARTNLLNAGSNYNSGSGGARRIDDAAGPVPGFSGNSRPVVRDQAGGFQRINKPEQRGSSNAGAESRASQEGGPATKDATPANSGASTSPAQDSGSTATTTAPVPTPSVSLTPYASQSSAPTATPQVTRTTWSAKFRYYKLWAELNWIPLSIGTVAAIILLAFAVSRLRRSRAAKSRRAPKLPTASRQKQQPAYEENSLPDPPLRRAAATSTAGRSSRVEKVEMPTLRPPVAEAPEREVFEL